MKVIVIRSGSSLLFSEFGTRHVKVGDVVLLDAQTLCGAEPEGNATTTTIYLDRDYVIDQVFWQYSAQFCDRHNARDFFESHYSTPAQIVRIGEDRAGMVTPWLDELASLSLDGPQPERFLRAQALLFSVLDVIVPFMATAAGTPSIVRGSAVVPAAPRHREFKPLRVEAHHIAQLIREEPARQWTGTCVRGQDTPAGVVRAVSVSSLASRALTTPPVMDPAPSDMGTFAPGSTTLPTAQMRSWLV